MLNYAYLTHHIVPGPQSVSYFIAIALLPIALLIPQTVLSRWQSICLFMPLMVASTAHAWVQMRGIDVISIDVLLWAFYLLVLKNPWKDFRYVGLLNRREVHTDTSDYEIGAGRPYPLTLRERIPWVGTLLISIRLQGWKTGKHSDDIRQRTTYRTTTRAGFSRQALLSFIRGYLVLDLTRAYHIHDPYFTDLNISVDSHLPFSEPTGLLLPRIFRSCVMGAEVWALISQFIYTPCIILVGLNALHWLPDEWSPHTWPPLFGDPMLILERGVRGLWGQYWHQAMRAFTSAPGEAVADLLRLKQKRLARYAMVVMISFGLSGVIHMGLVPPEPLCASMAVNEIRLHVAGFFWLQPFAITVEICAVRVLRVLVQPQFLDTGTGNRLTMVANMIWLMFWFSLCLPIFGEAARQLGYWRVWLVPVSLWRGLEGQAF